MKREAVTHTKMKRLCRRMKIPLWQAIGLLESIWLLASREAPAGNLGKLSDEDIAIAIDYQDGEAELIQSLVDCGWLDRDEKYRLVVHDWYDHADDATHMRLARSRTRFWSGESPKTYKLPPKEREEADAFFGTVRTDRKSVRTEVENVRTPCPSSSSSPAPPEPRLGVAHKSVRTPCVSTTAADLVPWMQQVLGEYPGAQSLPGPPDTAIATRCLEAVGWDLKNAIAALEHLHRARKKPDRSWAWFPIAMSNFKSEAS